MTLEPPDVSTQSHHYLRHHSPICPSARTTLFRRRSRRLMPATVIHLHVRDPVTGRPSSDAERFERVVGRIRAGCDALPSITTGGSAPAPT
ncbi:MULTISPECIES: 3-keto-5-aminohexanoate cleavage protein [Mesorhizobium]